MAVYAIGDIQGCYTELRSLLDRIAFDADKDELWLTGDLVNRGTDSLSVLRFVRGLGDSARCVLGNHDLHLLALACGARRGSRRDTLEELLAADDAEELIHRLRHRPMLHHDESLGWTMVHAGLPPQWDLATAFTCAQELESRLQRADYASLLAVLFGDLPDAWSTSLSGIERLRFTTNCLTRLRYCQADGKLALAYKGAPGTQPDNLMPWFRVPHRASQQLRIVFGHWSTLPLLNETNLLALDGGCVWGGRLVAARLDGELQLTQVSCAGHQAPLG
jgi:bis(5'-nucleosyl)-tetraphosphatase (symmetrical)